MMYRANILHDTQTDRPLTYCAKCGGEIYHYDRVVDVDGALVHVDCIHPKDREFYRIAPAISFFEEEY